MINIGYIDGMLCYLGFDIGGSIKEDFCTKLSTNIMSNTPPVIVSDTMSNGIHHTLFETVFVVLKTDFAQATLNNLLLLTSVLLYLLIHFAIYRPSTPKSGHFEKLILFLQTYRDPSSK